MDINRCPSAVVAYEPLDLTKSEVGKSPDNVRALSRASAHGLDCAVSSASLESSSSRFAIGCSESATQEDSASPHRLVSDSNAAARQSSTSDAASAENSQFEWGESSAEELSIAADAASTEASDAEDSGADGKDFSVSIDPVALERLLSGPVDEVLAFWGKQVGLVDSILARALCNRLRLLANEAGALSSADALYQELQDFARLNQSEHRG